MKVAISVEEVLDVDRSPIAGEFVGHRSGEGIVGEEVQSRARETVGAVECRGFGGRGLRGCGEFTGVQGHFGVGGLDEGMDAGDPVGDVPEVRGRGDRFVEDAGAGRVRRRADTSGD